MTKANITLVGEAWGENEAKTGQAFCGASGLELLKMLGEAGVIELTPADFDYMNKFWSLGDPFQLDMAWRLHPEVYRTNVFNIRPPGNKVEWFTGGKAEALRGYPVFAKGKYIRAEFAPELTRLGDELIEQNPNLIICLGNTPLWALGGQTGISKARGTTRLSTHTVSGFKILGTYHPAAVLRQWELRPTTVMDLIKAGREQGYGDIRRPKREVWIEPSIEDIERFINERIIGCERLSVDIETAGSRVTCIGFAPSSQSAIVVPFDDARRKGRNYWPTLDLERAAWNLVRSVLEDRAILKTFQNGLYDIAFLWRSMGLRLFGATHDTMLLHHALQPESLKGLGFMGSVYTDEGSWKSERKASTTIKRDE